MYNQIIKLVRESKSTDEYGDTKIVEEYREIFAEPISIGMSEFYAASASGLKPTIKFVIPDYLDYHNEKKLLFKDFGEENEHEFTILRTYRKGNELEITCEGVIEDYANAKVSGENK